jgi:hypothetical protein
VTSAKTCTCTCCLLRLARFMVLFPSSLETGNLFLKSSLAASTADSFLPFFVGGTFLRAFLPAARFASASSAAFDCARIVARESAARACFASLATLPFRIVGSPSFESSFLRYIRSVSALVPQGREPYRCSSSGPGSRPMYAQTT